MKATAVRRPLGLAPPNACFVRPRRVSNAAQCSGDQSAPPQPADGKSGVSELVLPWKLMGRVLPASRLAASDDFSAAVLRAAAANASGLDVEEFEARLLRLLVVMPFLAERLARMKPGLLAALARDVDGTAERVIQLKALMPAANIEALLRQRPSLLLDPEFQKVPAGLESLHRHFSEQDAAAMASAEPLLLLEDIDTILRELGRLVPAEDAAAALRGDPSIAFTVGGLRELSLW